MAEQLDFGIAQLGEFTQLINQNPSEFTGELFGSVSRHLGGLINGRDRLVFDEAKELLKALEVIDTTSLSQRRTPRLTQTPSTCSQCCATSKPVATSRRSS